MQNPFKLGLVIFLSVTMLAQAGSHTLIGKKLTNTLLSLSNSANERHVKQ